MLGSRCFNRKWFFFNVRVGVDVDVDVDVFLCWNCWCLQKFLNEKTKSYYQSKLWSSKISTSVPYEILLTIWSYQKWTPAFSRNDFQPSQNQWMFISTSEVLLTLFSHQKWCHLIQEYSSLSYLIDHDCKPQNKIIVLD